MTAAVPERVIEDAAQAVHAASDLGKIMPWDRLSAETHELMREIVRDAAPAIWNAALEAAADAAATTANPRGAVLALKTATERNRS